MNTDPKRALLRHFLAALAYRTQKALRGAPVGFDKFRAGAQVRTPHELVWHMSGVLGYARTFLIGGDWRPNRVDSFEGERDRFYEIVEDLASLLGTDLPIRDVSCDQLLQGPFADAMTHVGQLAMLRRLAGSPVPPENFIRAEITVGNLGPHQAAPVEPMPDWTPTSPPPEPGAGF